MRRVICQLDWYPKSKQNNDKYKYFYRYGIPSVKSYAKKHKIEYLLFKKNIDKAGNNPKIHFFYEIHEQNKYDQILFLDLDILILNRKINIFEEVDADAAICARKTLETPLKESWDFFKKHKVKVSKDTPRFNTGVILFNTKKSNSVFSKISINIDFFYSDEMYLMYLMQNKQYDYQIIDNKWNHNIINKQTLFFHWFSSLHDKNMNNKKSSKKLNLFKPFKIS